MSEYEELFLNRSGAIVMLDCLEVTHPSFAETYHVVRNATAGVTVTYKDLTTHYCRYVPMLIEEGGTSDDLDVSLRISIADMGTQLANDIDAVLSGDFSHIKPKVKRRIYLSDDLSRPRIEGQYLEVSNMSRDNSGSTTFVAMAQQLNNTKTGMIYSFVDFKSLKGYL